MNVEDRGIDPGVTQEADMPVASVGGVVLPPTKVLARRELNRVRSLDGTWRRCVELRRPSVLLVNFDALDVLRMEFALRLCVAQIGDVCVDIFNLGSSQTGLREISGSAAAVVLLKIPDPKQDLHGFSWARKTLNQLGARRKLWVVPVIRDHEQAPVFMRAIARACPYYMSAKSDFGDQCRMLTVLIESLC